ncbi:MAG: hypothetical protein JW841_03595 [Deltaproteobacteria bacterium]|nr:hypothetical protein [Deltaproteobacteria bacterium]
MADVDYLRNTLSERMTRRSKEMKPATVNRHLAVLRSALRAAATDGYEHHIFSGSIKFLAEENERDRVCSEEEYHHLISSAHPELQLAIMIHANTLRLFKRLSRSFF